MNEKLNKGYKGFIGWINYIRDYQDNIEYLEIKEGEAIEKNKEIKRLKKRLNQEMVNKVLIEKEKDNLLKLREEKIEILSKKLSETKIQLKKEYEENEQLYNENLELGNKLIEKENQRRKYAGAIGGLKAKINTLEKQLEKANLKINWLSNNQKAPTKEEIQAYDTRMKEVEKRLKEKDNGIIQQ